MSENKEYLNKTWKDIKEGFNELSGTLITGVLFASSMILINYCSTQNIQKEQNEKSLEKIISSTEQSKQNRITETKNYNFYSKENNLDY